MSENERFSDNPIILNTDSKLIEYTSLVECIKKNSELGESAEWYCKLLMGIKD